MRVLLVLFFCSLSFYPLFATKATQSNKQPVFDELTIIKKENSPSEKIFLLLSGIQGDEPGGFNAATLIAGKHYTIKKGNIWIVPTLNMHSILENHRGIYGDMNRKFTTLNKNDPEKKLIEHIKQLIQNERVEVLLHLHDGSGFYHETHISNLRNPNRWGQISIIDQEKLDDGIPHGNLDEIAKQITSEINKSLLKDLHRYRIRNTNTATKDKEMQKALTFYAINQGKAAFANEASKNLPLKERVYYHLLAIEAMMRYLGIEYERDFPLTPDGVESVINDKEITIHFANQITLPINRLKNVTTFFPMPKNGKIEYDSENPLVHFYEKKDKKGRKQFFIRYGNRISTRLVPDYFQTDTTLKSVQCNVDGKSQGVALGSIIKAKKSFFVESIKDPSIRVNIIGFSRKGLQSEEKIVIKKDSISSRYTMDKEGDLVRVEFYKNQYFSGMILVDFAP